MHDSKYNAISITNELRLPVSTCFDEGTTMNGVLSCSALTNDCYLTFGLHFKPQVTPYYACAYLANWKKGRYL